LGDLIIKTNKKKKNIETIYFLVETNQSLLIYYTICCYGIGLCYNY
jgi:hypothetical protein